MAMCTRFDNNKKNEDKYVLRRKRSEKRFEGFLGATKILMPPESFYTTSGYKVVYFHTDFIHLLLAWI